MIIERKSIFSDKVNSMDLDVTQEQLDRHKSGELVQNVFPNLTADEREFLVTGATPEEWDFYMGVGEE